MFVSKIGVALRDMVESLGPVGTKVAIRDMLKKKELKPEDFTSFQEIWAACERDSMGNVRSIEEAVSSDLFPVITGEIISARVIEGYQSVDMVSDQLVTTVPSKLMIDTIAGFTAVGGPDVVLEGQPYNERAFEEKYVTIPHVKVGDIIRVTEETILFDQTGQILIRAATIGEKTAQLKEKTIVQGVIDLNSKVFKPSAVDTAFYRTSASGDRKVNSAASCPFGEAGLLKAMALFHNMTDEQGDYVAVRPANLIGLFPFDLWVRVAQMIQSTLVPEGTENAVNIWKGLFKPLTSPYVTEQSASTWYLGDFKKDFWWSEIWPLQTFTMRPGSEMEFTRDIKSQTKVRYFGGVGAVDDKHSLKLTA